MDKPKRYTLKKNERLSSKIMLDELFKKENQLKQKSYPFLLVAKSVPFNSFAPPVQIVFSVSKKRVKKAVTRNKIKRTLREAYRLNKHIIYDSLLRKEQKLIISLIYIDSKVTSFSETQEKIIVLLNRLKQQVEKPY